MQRGEENRWLSQLPFPAPSPFPFKETQTLSMLSFTVCFIVYYIFHHDKVKVIHLNDSLLLLLFIYFIVQHLLIAEPPHQMIVGRSIICNAQSISHAQLTTGLSKAPKLDVIINTFTRHVAHVLSLRVREHLLDQILYTGWHNYSVTMPENSVRCTDISRIKPFTRSIWEEMLVSKETSLALENVQVDRAMTGI